MQILIFLFIVWLVWFFYFLFIFVKLFVQKIFFNRIIKYANIDELDIFKKNSLDEQRKIVEEKLMEKAQLINYRIMRALEKLVKTKYLSYEEYERTKNYVEFAMEKTGIGEIVIPEINPKLFLDLKVGDYGLFLEFKNIFLEQSILKKMIVKNMPLVFGNKITITINPLN